MAVFEIADLPDQPLAAAHRFHSESLAEIESAISGAADNLTLIFPALSHEHRGWVLAAVQELARAHTPLRVNAVAGDDAGAVVAACAYLDRAPGITAQVLHLDGNGASALLSETG